jgi:O-antigen ligase
MRLSEAHRHFSELFWRFVPVGTLIVFLSYLLGSQLLSPQRRVVKALVTVLVAAIMWRFEMIFTLYIFVVLFPVPSGIAVTSTNVALMTLLFLLWVVRANAQKLQILPRTQIDIFVVLFLMAYIVSFFNVPSMEGIVEGLKLVWRQLTAFAFFYLIVRFVDSEDKLERFTKVVGYSAAFLAFTAVVELYAPGATIIPGWIKLDEQIGEGTLGYRLEGLRLGGAVGSHGLLSDYCTLALFFMGLHFVRSRNIIPKLFWLLVTIMTFIVLIATANRGAFLALAIGFFYSMWVFRPYMNFTRYVVMVAGAVALFGVTQVLIGHHQFAVSVIDRLLATEMKGFVPESREGLYEPILRRCLDHIFIGHGPHYGIGAGRDKAWTLGDATRLYWPHNGYLYFLFTLGLFGLASFLAICYKLLRMSLVYTREHLRGTTLGMITSAVHIQLVLFLIVQLRTDHQRDNNYVYIYIVWMIFGLVVAAYNLVRKREREMAAASSQLAESREGVGSSGGVPGSS